MGGEAIKSKSKLSLLLALVVAVILLAASFLLGYSTGTGKIAPGAGLGLGESSDCTDSQLLTRLLESGYLPPEFDPSAPIMNISGEITKVGDDYLEVSAQLTPIDDAKIFKVQVDAETQLIIRKEKSPEELESEFQTFNQAMQNLNPERGNEPPEPPNPYTEQPIALKDIEVGLTATISSDVNLRENSTFTASSVYILRPMTEGPASSLSPDEIPEASPADDEPAPAVEEPEPGPDEEPLPVEEPMAVE